MSALSDESDRWLGIFGELFADSTRDGMACRIAEELRVSLGADAVLLHWFVSESDTGLVQWPRKIPETIVREHLSKPAAFTTDPLWIWFDRTQNPTPNTYGRVPAQWKDGWIFGPYAELARSCGIEHRLSIPVELGRGQHVAFIAAREAEDFAVDDLAVAARIRPLLKALHRQSLVLQTGAPVARATEEGCLSRGITEKERAVLTLLADGLTAYSIGLRMSISVRTVHKHLEHAYAKLGVSDRLTAVDRARRSGLLPTPREGEPTTIRMRCAWRAVD